MIKNRLTICLLSAGLFLLPSLVGSSVQAEVMYQISEPELTQLEQNLTTLQNHSEQKQILLNEQAKQLNEAQKQLEIVNEQLKKSQELNEQTQNSLERADQFLKEYEREAERKVKIKTRQRNFWIVISVVAVGSAISRR